MHGTLQYKVRGQAMGKGQYNESYCFMYCPNDVIGLFVQNQVSLLLHPQFTHRIQSLSSRIEFNHFAENLWILTL